MICPFGSTSLMNNPRKRQITMITAIMTTLLGKSSSTDVSFLLACFLAFLQFCIVCSTILLVFSKSLPSSSKILPMSS